MDDRGFVLIDALSAAVVVAIAGGAAVATMAGLIHHRQGLVDRSVEEVNVHSFIETLTLDWRSHDNREWDDGQFLYRASESQRAQARGLVRVRIQSTDRAGNTLTDFEIWVPS